MSFILLSESSFVIRIFFISFIFDESFSLVVVFVVVIDFNSLQVVVYDFFCFFISNVFYGTVFSLLA